MLLDETNRSRSLPTLENFSENEKCSEWKCIMAITKISLYCEHDVDVSHQNMGGEWYVVVRHGEFGEAVKMVHCPAYVTYAEQEVLNWIDSVHQYEGVVDDA